MERALYPRSIVGTLCFSAVAVVLSGCGAEVYTNEDLDRLPPTTELPPDDGSPGVVVAAAPEPKAR